MPLPPPRRERLPAPPPPPRKLGSAILQVSAVVLIILGGIFYMLWEGEKLPNDPGVISELRTAARLNPFPKEAGPIKMVPPEESVDSNYGILFTAPDTAVETWLAISPGTQGVKGEYLDGNIFRYVIPSATPARKQALAEVRWQRTAHTVYISVPPKLLLGEK